MTDTSNPWSVSCFLHVRVELALSISVRWQFALFPNSMLSVMFNSLIIHRLQIRLIDMNIQSAVTCFYDIFICFELYLTRMNRTGFLALQWNNVGSFIIGLRSVVPLWSEYRSSSAYTFIGGDLESIYDALTIITVYWLTLYLIISVNFDIIHTLQS